MTTTAVLSPPRLSADFDQPAPGTTTIANRTVERIAGHAITELDGVGGSARRVLGVALGNENLDASANVAATVTGNSVVLTVQLSVSYPQSVTRTSEDARTHLMRRIHDFTGLAVSRVDITVTALHSGAPSNRRVL
ncbi:hypothetical protein GCM10009765_21990 [Fodinicola feengrottensis]|uniref:Asp23/Gls24 family envelope stress response protein n=1 Tax=Fodinicola feengrottensis TaxID=435914 RepID=A0ABN2GJN1_9ACTN